MKIGIVTFYYKSFNYGGNLQAYALVKYLNKIGYSAEQICCCSEGRARVFSSSFKKLSTKKKIQTVAKRILSGVFEVKCFLFAGKQYRQIKRREDKISKFNQYRIKHSSNIYFDVDFSMASPKYDLFIAGSDQIWNTHWGYPSIYFLGAITGIKISYAASLGKSDWTAEELQVFKRYLADFSAVSVREEDASDILRESSPVPVEWVVDPTLLLTKEEWDEVCSDRIIPEPYVFCYFLGTDLEQRNLAIQYAKQKGLKLVTIPFLHKKMLLNREFRKFESTFGDEQLYEVSPEQFLSLIKYAFCVFTDSFHATVFSGIYQREYFVFGRAAMESRITSLTKLFETEERFCNTPKRRNIDYIQTQYPIDYSRDLKWLLAKQKSSKEYLDRSLYQAKRQFTGI